MGSLHLGIIMDIRQIGAETCRRTEATSVVTLFNSSTNTKGIWLIPFTVYGYLTVYGYSVNIDFTPFDGDDQYAYKMAIYRVNNDITDTSSATGIGDLVSGTELASGTLTGNLTVQNTSALTNPVNLIGGQYFFAFHPYLIGTPTGALTVVSNDGIDCYTAGLTGIDNGHKYGVVATAGTLPTKLTTDSGTMDHLVNCFSVVDSFWAGIRDSRST